MLVCTTGIWRFIAGRKLQHFPPFPPHLAARCANRQGRHRMMAMRQFAKFGVLFLVLLIGGAPLMACTLPSAILTPAERACCRQMASQCGGEQMPASHSCCKSIAPPFQIPISKSSIQLVYQVHFLYLVTVDPNHLPQNTSLRYPAIDHSPPDAHPSSPLILRI